MITTKFGFKCAGGMMLAVAAIVAMLLVALVAHGHALGQPAAHAVAATQPASQPAVTVPVGKWLAGNAWWLVPVALLALSTLATFLSRYPRAKGVVAALRWVVGALSTLEFKDGKRPGLVLKPPLWPPSPPPDGTAAG